MIKALEYRGRGGEGAREMFFFFFLWKEEKMKTARLPLLVIWQDKPSCARETDFSSFQ